jgi:glutathione S-transferase
LEDFPNVKRWFETIHQRQATQNAYRLSEQLNPKAPKLPPLV